MKASLWPRAIVPGSSNPVCIRTAIEGDADKLGDYFAGLSQSAHYNRFMGAVGKCSRIARDCLMRLALQSAEMDHPAGRLSWTAATNPHPPAT